MDSIRTPLLRYLILYFGVLGIQLLPVRVSNVLSVLSFGANLVAFCLSAYGWYLFSSSDALYHRLNKPIQLLLMRFSYGYFFIICHLTYLCYFMIAGPKLSLLLDSTVFHQVYQCRTKSRKIFFSILLLILCRYIVSYLIFLLRFAHTPNKLLVALVYLTTYINNAQYLFLWILNYYFQYGVHCALRDLIHRCPKQAINFTTYEFKTLCLLVERVNQWLAFPLLYFFIVATLDVVQGCCIILTTPLGHHYQILVHHCFMITIEIGITLLNYQNQKLAGEIWQWIIKRNQVRVRIFFMPLQSQAIRNYEFRSTFIKNGFSINIFQLFQFNFRFLFQMALFVLTYTVFILQTNNR